MAKIKQLKPEQLLGRLSIIMQQQHLGNVAPALMSAMAQVAQIALPHPTVVSYMVQNLRIILDKLEREGATAIPNAEVERVGFAQEYEDVSDSAANDPVPTADSDIPGEPFAAFNAENDSPVEDADLVTEPTPEVIAAVAASSDYQAARPAIC